jgi:basic amino acid/polyamine antiporter, APA family
MTQLARKLRITDYFCLGWGTMIGVGWLVVMDDWLLRGGTLGGILGFAIGGILLLPIGYVYGKLVMAMPDAGGEVAYTARVFPRPVSFLHRMDDDARLLHRLPVGSCGCWPYRRLYLSRA